MEAPLVFEEAVELEHPIVLLEPLAFLLNRLLEQICARLASRALATQELRLTLELANFTGMDEEFENIGIPSESDGDETDRDMLATAEGGWPSERSSAASRRQNQFHRTLRLPLPMLDAKVFLKLLQLDLNAHPPGAPIVKIHLAAEPARPRSAQGGLFCLPRPNRKNWNSLWLASPAWSARKKSARWNCSTRIIPKDSACGVSCAEAPKKSAEKISGLPAEENPRHGPAPLPSSAARHVTLEDGQPVRMVCAKKKEVQGDVLWKAGPWRCLRRLVGTRSLVPRRMGHRLAKRQKPSPFTAWCTICSAEAGLWKERMTEMRVSAVSESQRSEF